MDYAPPPKTISGRREPTRPPPTPQEINAAGGFMNWFQQVVLAEQEANRSFSDRHMQGASPEVIRQALERRRNTNRTIEESNAIPSTGTRRHWSTEVRNRRAKDPYGDQSDDINFGMPPILRELLRRVPGPR